MRPELTPEEAAAGFGIYQVSHWPGFGNPSMRRLVPLVLKPIGTVDAIFKTSDPFSETGVSYQHMFYGSKVPLEPEEPQDDDEDDDEGEPQWHPVMNPHRRLSTALKFSLPGAAVDGFPYRARRWPAYDFVKAD